MRVHQVRVGIDHHLLHLAAIGQRNAGALHVRQPRPDELQAVVVQIGLAQPLRRSAPSCTIGTDDASYLITNGGKRARRQHAQNRLHDRRDLRQRQLDLHLRLEVTP